MKKLFTFLFIGVFSMLVMPNVMAMEPQFFSDLGSGNRVGHNIFFANGNPITITERSDGEAGALVKWDGGQLAVPAGTTVFGGGHALDLESTSVKMTGGKVHNIFGGGLHASVIDNTSVVVENGTVTCGIQGGSAASLLTDEHGAWYSGVAKDSPVVVKNASVVVKNVNANIVYGGGEGISSTEKVVVVIENGTFNYVIAGGSNGYTKDASVRMNGGTTNYLFAGNRGSMGTSEIIVDGAVITNALVAGGDEADNNVVFEGNALMEIISGEVIRLGAGTNGGSNLATDISEVSYHDGTVRNVEGSLDNDKIMVTVTLTFYADGEAESMEIPKGVAFSEEDVANIMKEFSDACKDEGLEFVGFYKDSEFLEELDLTEVIDNNLDVYIKTVQLRAEEPEENVNTADLNFILILLGLAISGTGLILTIRKRQFS